MVTSRRQAGIRNSLSSNKENRRVRSDRTPPKLPDIIIGHRVLAKQHKPEDESHSLEILSENLDCMNHPGLGQTITPENLVLHILSPSSLSSLYETYRQKYLKNVDFKQRRNKYYEMKTRIAKEFKLQMIYDSNMQKQAVESASEVKIDLGPDDDGLPDYITYTKDPGPQHSLGGISLPFSSLYSSQSSNRSVLCINPVGFGFLSTERSIDKLDSETRDTLGRSLDRVNQALHEVGLIRNLKTDALRFRDMSVEMPVFEKTSPNAEIYTPIIPMGRVALQPLSVHVS